MTDKRNPSMKVLSEPSGDPLEELARLIGQTPNDALFDESRRFTPPGPVEWDPSELPDDVEKARTRKVLGRIFGSE